MAPLARRLREARLNAGFSLEKLGIDAGLDPASARTRMSRYELGKRVPDYELVEKLARVLGLSATYFYAAEDDEAELLLRLHRLSQAKRIRLMAAIAAEENLPS